MPSRKRDRLLGNAMGGAITCACGLRLGDRPPAPCMIRPAPRHGTLSFVKGSVSERSSDYRPAAARITTDIYYISSGRRSSPLKKNPPPPHLAHGIQPDIARGAA